MFCVYWDGGPDVHVCSRRPEILFPSALRYLPRGWPHSMSSPPPPRPTSLLHSPAQGSHFQGHGRTHAFPQMIIAAVWVCTLGRCEQSKGRLRFKATICPRCDRRSATGPIARDVTGPDPRGSLWGRSARGERARVTDGRMNGQMSPIASGSFSIEDLPAMLNKHILVFYFRPLSCQIRIKYKFVKITPTTNSIYIKIYKDILLDFVVA